MGSASWPGRENLIISSPEIGSLISSQLIGKSLWFYNTGASSSRVRDPLDLMKPHNTKQKRVEAKKGF